MLTRPNLNAVVLAIIDYVYEATKHVEAHIVQVYINVLRDGTWYISDEPNYSGSTTSLFVGSTTHKLLRKDVKVALDILEGSINDRRKGNSRKVVDGSKASRGTDD